MVIDAKFISKLGSVDNIILNDVADIDGWSREGK